MKKSFTYSADTSSLVMRISVLILGFLISGTAASGQTHQKQFVQGSAGIASAGGGLISVTSGGQSVVGVSRGAQFVNCAGFLQSTVLRPDLDHDQDGLCDEIDFDNDNDGIEDLAELLGAEFTPNASTDVNNPDSDNDGLSDGGELVAGTSPTTQSSSLKVLDIRKVGSGFKIDWTGGTTARQYVLRKTSMLDDWVVVYTNEPPTLVQEAVLDVTTNTTAFYTIRVERL